MKLMQAAILGALLTGCVATTQSRGVTPAVPMPVGADPVAWKTAPKDQKILMWSREQDRLANNGSFIAMQVTPEMRQLVTDAVKRSLGNPQNAQFQKFHARRTRRAPADDWSICGLVNARDSSVISGGWHPFFFVHKPGMGQHGVQDFDLAKRACAGDFVPIGS